MPEEDREWFRRASLIAGLATANMNPDAVMQYALADIEANVLLDMRALQLRRNRVLDALRAARYEANTPEATFYVMVRSPIEDDRAFCRELAKDKVLVLPGSAFEMPGWFRISLTGTDEMFNRALPVLARARRQ